MLGLDKYGRTIADVLLPDGTNVNRELVKEGWCWWYRRYAPGDTGLEGLETECERGGRGCGLIRGRCRRGSSLNKSGSRGLPTGCSMPLTSVPKGERIYK